MLYPRCGRVCARLPVRHVRMDVWAQFLHLGPFLSNYKG